MHVHFNLKFKKYQVFGVNNEKLIPGISQKSWTLLPWSLTFRYSNGALYS